MNDDMRKRIIDLYQKYETPFYLYDESVINSQADALIKGFGDFEFLYSVKTNPHGPVARFIFSKGIGADAASAREVEIAHEAGLPPEKVLFSAPGKTESDIRGAFDKSIIIADSYNELRLLNRVAAESGRIAEVGVRINPDFSMTGGKGTSGKFGIDEESIPGNLEMLRGLANIATWVFT